MTFVTNLDACITTFSSDVDVESTMCDSSWFHELEALGVLIHMISQSLGTTPHHHTLSLGNLQYDSIVLRFAVFRNVLRVENSNKGFQI